MSSVKRSIVEGMVFVFLLANLVIRVSTILYYPPYSLVMGGLIGGVAIAGIIVVFFQYF